MVSNRKVNPKILSTNKQHLRLDTAIASCDPNHIFHQRVINKMNHFTFASNAYKAIESLD